MIPKSTHLSRSSILDPRSSIACVAILLLLSGCTRDWKSQPVSMWNESRYKPMEEVKFFNNGSASQPLVPGTVARGHLRTNDAMYLGRTGGALVTKFPFAMKTADLARGQEQFNIYCSPCHAKTGDGTGMIVQRGFAPPPHYGTARLRKAPVGHFYDVITNGYGAMYSYASRVQPEDRWRIAAYIRVLQGRFKEVVPETPRSPSSTAPSSAGTMTGAPTSGMPGTSAGATDPNVPRDLQIAPNRRSGEGVTGPSAVPGGTPVPGSTAGGLATEGATSTQGTSTQGTATGAATPAQP